MGNAFEKFFKENETPPVDVKAKPDDKRVIGKIIKISDEEGWGFISSKEVKFTRIFFHWTSLRQDTKNFTELTVGMKVEFTPVKTENQGWKAIKIKVVE